MMLFWQIMDLLLKNNSRTGKKMQIDLHYYFVSFTG